MAIAHKLVEFHLSPVKSRISWESIREEWSLKAITSDVQLSSLDRKASRISERTLRRKGDRSISER
jgi:hypothetical protein